METYSLSLLKVFSMSKQSLHPIYLLTQRKLSKGYCQYYLLGFIYINVCNLYMLIRVVSFGLLYGCMRLHRKKDRQKDLHQASTSEGLKHSDWE